MKAVECLSSILNFGGSVDSVRHIIFRLQNNITLITIP